MQNPVNEAKGQLIYNVLPQQLLLLITCVNHKLKVFNIQFI